MKPRIKRKKRGAGLRHIWTCSAADDAQTFRITGTGMTPRSAYAAWKYSNDLPF